MPTEFQKYWPVLRQLEFKKQWASRHQDGDSRQYSRDYIDNLRTIEVRINEEPPHHVTHCVHHPENWNRARWTTLPIEFTDEQGLIAAVNSEKIRPHQFDDPSELSKERYIGSNTP